MMEVLDTLHPRSGGNEVKGVVGDFEVLDCCCPESLFASNGAGAVKEKGASVSQLAVGSSILKIGSELWMEVRHVTPPCCSHLVVDVRHHRHPFYFKWK